MTDTNENANDAEAEKPDKPRMVEIPEDVLAGVFERVTRLETTQAQRIANDPVAEKKKPFLKGNRTKTANLALGLVVIAMLAMLHNNPEKAAEFILSVKEAIAGGTIGLVWLVNKFYELKGTDK